MNSSEILINEANLELPSHRTVVAQLLETLMHEGNLRYGRDSTGQPEEAAQIGNFFTTPEFGSRIFLASSKGENLAIAICQTHMSSWRLVRVLNIHDLFVLPSWRGQGIGSMLLERIESTARSEAFGSVSLETNLGNSGAIKLYLGRGYRCTSRSLQPILETTPIDLAKQFPDLTINFQLETE